MDEGTQEKIPLFSDGYSLACLSRRCLSQYLIIAQHPHLKLLRLVLTTSVECQGVKAIVDALGPDSITMDEDDIDLHSNSEALTAQCATKPVAVVSPKNAADVLVIARITRFT